MVSRQKDLSSILLFAADYFRPYMWMIRVIHGEGTSQPTIAALDVSDSSCLWQKCGNFLFFLIKKTNLIEYKIYNLGQIELRF